MEGLRTKSAERPVERHAIITSVRPFQDALSRRRAFVSVQPQGTITSMNTATTIPIENLSTADKIVLMERLWDNLSRCPTDIVSPDWHGEILEGRRAAALEGRTAFVDWEDAKKRLRER